MLQYDYLFTELTQYWKYALYVQNAFFKGYLFKEINESIIISVS